MNHTNIKQIIESYSGLNLSLSTNKREYVYHRWMYWGLAYKYFKVTTSVLGASCGRNHSTVVNALLRQSYGMSKLDNLLQSDVNYRALYNSFENLIINHNHKKIEDITSIETLKNVFYFELNKVRKEERERYEIKLSKEINEIKPIDKQFSTLGNNREHFIETRLVPYLKLNKLC